MLFYCEAPEMFVPVNTVTFLPVCSTQGDAEEVGVFTWKTDISITRANATSSTD